jgi:hypothetical protein
MEAGDYGIDRKSVSMTVYSPAKEVDRRRQCANSRLGSSRTLQEFVVIMVPRAMFTDLLGSTIRLDLPQDTPPEADPRGCDCQ